MKPETKYGQKLRRALKDEFGGFWYKNHGSMFSLKGLPDLTGVVGGIYIGIENKVGDNEASTEQKEVLREIRENGGIAVISYSIASTIRSIRKALEVAKARRIIYVQKKTSFTGRGDGSRENPYDISEPSLEALYWVGGRSPRDLPGFHSARVGKRDKKMAKRNNSRIHHR